MDKDDKQRLKLNGLNGSSKTDNLKSKLSQFQLENSPATRQAFKPVLVNKNGAILDSKAVAKTNSSNDIQKTNRNPFAKPVITFSEQRIKTNITEREVLGGNLADSNKEMTANNKLKTTSQNKGLLLLNMEEISPIKVPSSQIDR